MTPLVIRPVASMVALGLVLSGCAAASTAVAKRNLDVQTKMSETIFLDPVAPEDRTVYVDIRNTSDRPGLDIGPQVRAAVQARGFQIVDDPRAARYVLQANVLQAGRSSETAAQAAYNSGFGGGLLGGAAGGAVGYGLGQAGIGVNDALGTIGGALAGAAISTLADAYTQDTTFTIVTDVQVSERTPGGGLVSQSEQASLSQGTSGTITQSSSQTTDTKRYRTRVVSTANQVNLDWPDAEPQLVAGLSRSIGGIF